MEEFKCITSPQWDQTEVVADVENNIVFTRCHSDDILVAFYEYLNYT